MSFLSINKPMGSCNLSSVLISFVVSFTFSFLPVPLDAKQKKSSQAQISQTSYRVKQGDTWWGISKKFNSTPSDLAKLNGRTETENLFVNELLRIPSKSLPLANIDSPKEKPDFPLVQKEKIVKKFSELTYDPHKGVLYQRGKTSLVRAALPGKVVLIDYMDGYENYVILEHQSGFYSVYGNLEKVQVTEGQTIQKKDRLGILGKEKGLYFQVNKNKTITNPERFLEIGT